MHICVSVHTVLEKLAYIVIDSPFLIILRESSSNVDVREYSLRKSELCMENNAFKWGFLAKGFMHCSLQRNPSNYAVPVPITQLILELFCIQIHINNNLSTF